MQAVWCRIDIGEQVDGMPPISWAHWYIPDSPGIFGGSAIRVGEREKSENENGFEEGSTLS